jgi:signal transduction histidine kinase
MDAMPAGGVLMLRTAHEDDSIDIEISDTGGGLTPEECERLFTPYYTTKQHGTGLGLAIVQSVVSDHGGRISVESETGVGTSFHIRLPIKSAAPPVATHEIREAHEPGPAEPQTAPAQEMSESPESPAGEGA